MLEGKKSIIQYGARRKFTGNEHADCLRANT